MLLSHFNKSTHHCLLESTRFPSISNQAVSSKGFFHYHRFGTLASKQPFLSVFYNNITLSMLLPKLFNTHHPDLLLCFKNVQQVYSSTISCTDAIVKCFCPAVHDGGTGAEDDSLFFIRLFYQPSQQLWQLKPWSSLACFHYIPCKLWHLISLKEMGFERWGTRVAKPSSPRCLIYCTWAAGCEKCLSCLWSSSLLPSFSVFQVQKYVFFICLFRYSSAFIDSFLPAELYKHIKTIVMHYISCSAIT